MQTVILARDFRGTLLYLHRRHPQGQHWTMERSKAERLSVREARHATKQTSAYGTYVIYFEASPFDLDTQGTALTLRKLYPKPAHRVPEATLTLRSRIRVRWTLCPADMAYEGTPTDWLDQPGDVMSLRNADLFDRVLTEIHGEGSLRLIRYWHKGREISLDQIRAVVVAARGRS